MAKFNPIEIQKNLGGVDYPASKQDLLDHVKNGSGNNDEAIKVLNQIPDKEYESPVDVTKAIGDLNDKE